MVTIDQLKKYIYIPDQAHSDDQMLEMVLGAAQTYIRNACNNYDILYEENDGFRKQADLATIIYAAELFNNRLLLSGNNGVPTFMIQALMLQLQTYSTEDKKI